MKINGPFLKGLLLTRQMKQYQLSQKIGISDSNCSKIILGKIGVSEIMLKKIADAIDVLPSDLKMPNKVSSVAPQPAPRVRHGQ